MHEKTAKLPFFHRPEFSYWLITSFCTTLLTIAFSFLPVMGGHAIGTAVAAELESVTPSGPARRRDAPEPRERPGIPVALGLKGTGP